MCRDINYKWLLLGKLNRKLFHPHSPRRNCSPRSAGAETHSSNGAPLPGGPSVRGQGRLRAPSLLTAQAWGVMAPGDRGWSCRWLVQSSDGRPHLLGRSESTEWGQRKGVQTPREPSRFSLRQKALTQHSLNPFKSNTLISKTSFSTPSNKCVVISKLYGMN